MAVVSASPCSAALPKKTKKPRPAATHLKTAEMVNAAITNLKERGGSSLVAIKKYVAGTYQVDMERLAPFIKKYVKTSVADGTLIQTKGKGASGSFKLVASARRANKVAVTSAVAAASAKPKTAIKKSTAMSMKIAAAAKKSTSASAAKDKKQKKPAAVKKAKKTSSPKKHSAAAAKKISPKTSLKKKSAISAFFVSTEKVSKSEKKMKNSTPKQIKSPKPKKTVATKKIGKNEYSQT